MSDAAPAFVRDETREAGFATVAQHGDWAGVNIDPWSVAYLWQALIAARHDGDAARAGLAKAVELLTTYRTMGMPYGYTHDEWNALNQRVVAVLADPTASAALDEVLELRRRVAEFQQAERETSDAYLRIRMLLKDYGSLDTQPGGGDRYMKTESTVRLLIQQLAAAEEWAGKANPIVRAAVRLFIAGGTKASPEYMRALEQAVLAFNNPMVEDQLTTLRSLPADGDVVEAVRGLQRELEASQEAYSMRAKAIAEKYDMEAKLTAAEARERGLRQVITSAADQLSYRHEYPGIVALLRATLAGTGAEGEI